MTSTLLINDRPYRLLAPGPVPVPPEVLRAMSEKVLHHRTPQFIQILHEVWEGLRAVFETAQPVQIVTGTGSAAMEAAVVNLLSPQDEVLCVVSGKFGERWAEICERYGVTTHRWAVPWGKTLNLEEFEAQLRAHPKIKMVLSQACETSTGTLHPIREMAVAVQKLAPAALFAVDGITAVGCTPLPMDEWGLDVVVAGSQKAFMIPTGLSFIALSEKAWRAQARAKLPSFYFNLAAEKKANAKGDSQFSVPTPLVVGLNVVLHQLERVGRERLWHRCAALAEATRQMGDRLGFPVYSQSPSPSVTALVAPTDSAALRDWLEQARNITVMGGQDQLKGKVLRIGHMGDVRNEDMLALFEALAEKAGREKEFAGGLRLDLERLLRLAEPLFS